MPVWFFFYTFLQNTQFFNNKNWVTVFYHQPIGHPLALLHRSFCVPACEKKLVNYYCQIRVCMKLYHYRADWGCPIRTLINELTRRVYCRVTGEDGCSALCHASQHGHIEILRKLVECHARVRTSWSCACAFSSITCSIMWQWAIRVSC